MADVFGGLIQETPIRRLQKIKSLIEDRELEERLVYSVLAPNTARGEHLVGEVLASNIIREATHAPSNMEIDGFTLIEEINLELGRRNRPTVLLG
jgi:hypothetical protein